jgi:hypothetical protein
MTMPIILSFDDFEHYCKVLDEEDIFYCTFNSTVMIDTQRDTLVFGAHGGKMPLEVITVETGDNQNKKQYHCNREEYLAITDARFQEWNRKRLGK